MHSNGFMPNTQCICEEMGICKKTCLQCSATGNIMKGVAGVFTLGNWTSFQLELGRVLAADKLKNHLSCLT